MLQKVLAIAAFSMMWNVAYAQNVVRGSKLVIIERDNCHYCDELRNDIYRMRWSPQTPFIPVTQRLFIQVEFVNVTSIRNERMVRQRYGDWFGTPTMKLMHEGDQVAMIVGANIDEMIGVIREWALSTIN